MHIVDTSGAVPARSFPGAPAPEADQSDAVGEVSADSLAAEALEFHRRGLRQKRFADLTREKYLLHIDGEGLSQFLDLFNGERLEIPFATANMPLMQDNLLRPCVDHMVAYHTQQPFVFIAEPKDEREARERALIDQIWVNHLGTTQRLNSTIGAALYMGCGAGHAPVHSYWRNDTIGDTYEPIKSGVEEQGDVLQFQPPPPGKIDLFVGDPFATVYHGGSKRTSVPMMTYERVMPAELVRQAFPQVEGLEGTDKIPSVSRYVRTVRNWVLNSSFVHGFGGMIDGQGSSELISLLYQEIAPNFDPRMPEGRMRLFAMKGGAEISQDGPGQMGEPILLHDGPPPGGCLSSVRIYSMVGGRQDDVHGKPFVADLDDDQMELNQALTERKMYLLRSTRAPLMTQEPLDQATDVWDQDEQMELEPGTQFIPAFLEPPHRHIAPLIVHIEELRHSIYTKAGYQAASRGESNPGDAAAKIVALARLDDTVHGPTNTSVREGVEDLVTISWKQFRQFADVPWIIDNVGSEHAHIVGNQIDRTMVSKEVPTFRLVSGFGATPDARAEQLLNLVQMRGADGEVLMSTRQFRAAWPDKTVYRDTEDPMSVRERRPRFINAELRRQTKHMLEQMAGQQMPPDMMEKFVPAMEAAIHQAYPVMPDDLLALHVQELGNITQDETELRPVRMVAGLRQARYRDILAELEAQQMEEPEEGRPAKVRSGPSQGEESTAKTPTSVVARLTREAKGART